MLCGTGHCCLGNFPVQYRASKLVPGPWSGPLVSWQWSKEPRLRLTCFVVWLFLSQESGQCSVATKYCDHCLSYHLPSQIEEFWRLYNNILTPDLMEQNSNFHFFKRGIKPLWEHPANLDGGKWLLTIKNDTTNLTNSWLDVVSLGPGGRGKQYAYCRGSVIKFSPCSCCFWLVGVSGGVAWSMEQWCLVGRKVIASPCGLTLGRKRKTWKSGKSGTLN